MSASKWGAVYWAFFHIISLNYPDNPTDKDMDYAKDLIKAIYYALPCEVCSGHYLSNIKANPLKPEDISSKTNFATWFINLHNTVNTLLNKPNLTYDEALVKINLVKNTYRYQEIFLRVLGYINVDKLNDKEKRNILRFIKCGMYFGGLEIKKGITLDFSSESSYKSLVKKLIA